MALVGEGEERLSAVFNDYDRLQVTPWLRENVLSHLDLSQALSQRENFKKIAAWFDEYSNGERVSVVTYGKTLDLVLLFELWHFAHPERPYFHYEQCLPDYLNHSAHFDMPTIFFLAGIDPDIDKEKFAGGSMKGRRHEALYDALVLRECFQKCLHETRFPGLEKISL